MRKGEELDLARIDPWLKERLPGLVGMPQVTQYSGGASNWTYRLRYDTHDLVLRRPPEGRKARGAHDVVREARLQQALRNAYPLVPEVFAICDDEAVIGAPFSVMERIEGVILRRDLPRGWSISPAQARALGLALLDALVVLHAVDSSTAELTALGKGAGYARRQVDGWCERYRQARTWNVPKATRLMGWLDRHVPPDAGLCVVHNDFRFANLVLDPDQPTRIRGVLDWELATIGDPLMDLGNALAYWVEAGDDWLGRASRRQPTHLPGMPTRAELVRLYAERTGRSIDAWPFHEAYGLFRLSVIAQQIYYRYHHGQTRNPAFRHYWVFVHYLQWRAARTIAAAIPARP